jgi:membrane fusion protein, multidrug efflux system
VNKTFERNAMETQTNGTIDASEPAEVEVTKQSSKSKGARRKYFIMLAAAILVAGAIGLGWWVYAQGREETDDSYVDGHITTIGSRVSGVVTEVLVEDNQLVKENQPLVRLDPNDYQARADKLSAAVKISQKQTMASQSKIGQSTLSAKGQATQAAGSINSSGADLERSEAALLAAQAEERQAASHVQEQEAQVAYTKSDYERYKTVYASRAVTKQQYDRAVEAWHVAQAQLKEAEDSLDQSKRKVLQAAAQIKDAAAHQLTSQGQYTSAVAAEKQTDIDRQQYQSNLAAIDQAKFDLKQAQLDLSYTKINAPLAGRVGRKTVEVGQRIEVGQALMAVVQPNPWVTANFKETQLNKMKVGQQAEIKIDSFPGKIFKGTVDSLSPASGARFSVLPPDNATGNFTKVVQRIPVKIVFDKGSLGDYASRISPGMSCTSTVVFK